LRQDRFLTAILAGIGLLAVAAVALFFLRPAGQEYTSDTSPAGVIQNYATALQKGDYQRAYTYLAAGPGRPEFTAFRREMAGQRSQLAGAALEADSTEQAGSDATVLLVVLHSSGGLFDDATREPQSAFLHNNGSGWKVVWAPYPYWSYAWPQAGSGYTPTPTARPLPTP